MRFTYYYYYPHNKIKQKKKKKTKTKKKKQKRWTVNDKFYVPKKNIHQRIETIIVATHAFIL